MAHEKNHDYHILNPSVWPFIGALSGFTMLFGAVLWMHDVTPFLFFIGLTGAIYGNTIGFIEPLEVAFQTIFLGIFMVLSVYVDMVWKYS